MVTQNQPVEHKNLIEALIAAQSEFTPVNKGKTATVKTKAGGEYKYKYADLADVLKMALPILTRHGMAVSQPLTRIDGKLFLVTELLHVSGEIKKSDGLRLLEDLAPQEFAADLTYWRRYDFCSLLGISPDEDTDAKSSKARDREPEEVRKSVTKPLEGVVIDSGDGEEGEKVWRWFYLQNCPDRLFLFDVNLFPLVVTGRRVTLMSEQKFNDRGRWFWNVTKIEAVTSEQLDKADYPPVRKPPSAPSEAPADILKRMFQGDVKKRRLVEENLKDQPEALHLPILKLFEARAKREGGVGSELNMLSLLDLSKQEAVEEAAEQASDALFQESK